MTFSIGARCPRTGAYGTAIATSATMVGSRCCYPKADVGVFITQHRTDPRLGPLGIAYLEQGLSAQQAMDRVVAEAPHVGWRQLACLDRHGGSACYHGEKIYSIAAAHTGEHCIAVGNILDNPRVPRAMIDAFMREPGAELTDRLLDALDGALEAGGEMQAVRSAAVLVVREQSFPLVDLRVDVSHQPVGELRRNWAQCRGNIEVFRTLALDPESLPPDPVNWALAERQKRERGAPS